MGKNLFRILVSMSVLISFIVGGMIIQQNIAEASFKEIKKEFKKGISATDVFVFKADGEPVKIRIKQDILSQKYYVLAFLDGEKIFDEEQTADKNIWMIREIQDKDSGRYFYCVSPGIEDPDYSMIMGYDPDKKKWMKYVDSSNFKNDVHGAAHILVNDKGDLRLNFNYPGEASHAYDFFWDDNSKWFGYNDLGVKGTIIHKQEKQKQKNVWFASVYDNDHWITQADYIGDNTYSASVTITRNGQFINFYPCKVKSKDGVAYKSDFDRSNGKWSAWHHDDYTQAMWDAIKQNF